MGKSKIKPHHKKKQPVISTSELSIDEDETSQIPPKKYPFNKLKSFIKQYKYWLLAALAVLMISIIWFLSQSWMVRSYFSQPVTYPNASVLGIDIGDLYSNKLNDQLVKLKTDFEAKKITLANGKDKWIFEPTKLGVTFDVSATRKSVLHFNSLNLVDKYKLLTGGISPIVVPTILINQESCVKELSVIPATQIAPQDASIYLDKGLLKIKPDKPGTKFNAVSTCKELPKWLSANKFVNSVYLDTSVAGLTKSDIESKLSEIQSIVGEPLILKSGNYQQTLSSEQLLAMLEIKKVGNEVKVNWLSDKLDETVNDIANKVNTYDSAPALSACQYVSSNGGNWLDTTATTKIFTDIGAGKPRSYNLPISHHEPVINSLKPVAPGNSGTIYLTYDDGLTFGNQIMNTAACYGIKVTFFELGTRVGTDAVALKRAIAEGHAVQSHGFEHAAYDYGQRSYDWQYNDISQSIIAITGVTGVRPTYFRPPGGNRSDNTYKAASENGINLILWGDSSRDSAPSGVTSAGTCAYVLAGAYPGASVLMHSIKQSTANAMPCIVEGLAARGYNMRALR